MRGILAILSALVPGWLWAASPVFDAKGFEPRREYFSQLPFEHIDPMTGNLLLTFTDLVLPGNAGFDLRIERTYNAKIYETYSSIGGSTPGEDSWAGIGWSLHFGRLLKAESLANPVLELPDGRQQPTYRHMDGNPYHFMTKEYWTVERVPGGVPVVRSPSGMRYTFGWRQGETRYATRIEDAFGNFVSISYAPPPAPGDVIQEVEQHLAGGQVRTVSFEYDNTLPGGSGAVAAGSLRTMTFEGRQWTYSQVPAANLSYTLLAQVQPPLDPPWTFTYSTAPSTTYMLNKLTTPNGGQIDYGYTPTLFYLGSTSFLSPAVTTRALSGRSVPSGTWVYQYSSTTAHNVTLITSPCNNIRTGYTFRGIGTNSGLAFELGALESKFVSSGTQSPLETETLVWDPSVPISNEPESGSSAQTRVALLRRRTVTRGTSNYVTTHTYDPSAYSLSRARNFNDHGRPVSTSEQGELSRTTTRTFFYGASSDPSFSPVYIVDKLALETVQVGTETFARSYVYDAGTGFLRSQTIYGITTSYTPTANGDVLTSTDANANVTRYEYNWGVASQVRTPEYTVDRTVDPDGTVASETRRGFTTRFQYDPLFRPTETRPPAGDAIVRVYDPAGQFVRVQRGPFGGVGGGGSFTRTNLDAFARPIGTENSAGIKTKLTYDSCGRTTLESYPFTGSSSTPPGTTYTYDALGRVTRRTHPGGAFAKYDYLPGVDIDVTDEELHVTKQDWSAFGDPSDARLMRVTDPTLAITLHAFNALGSLTSVTVPGVPARTWTYNTRNELIQERHPESGLTTYTYFAAGNLRTRSDAQFGVTTFGYDGNNRLTEIDRPGDADDVAIAYDDSDNRTELVTADVSSLFAYDAANRLVTRSDDLDGLIFDTVFAYDSRDNLKRLTYPSGASAVYDYDSENRITRVANGVGETYAHQFAYHPSGALAAYRAGNNLLHQFTYDTRYRLWTLNAGGALALTYTYDRVNNVKTLTDPRPGMSAVLEYDALDRLTKAGTALTFGYSPGGNRLFKQIGAPRTDYVYSATSQLLMSATGAEAETFTYDLNGNLKADARGTYSYAPTNMLTTAVAGGSSTRYVYDGDGLRKTRIATAGTSYFVHGPGGQLLGEYQESGAGLTVVREYVLAGTRLIADVAPTVLTIQPATLTFLAVLDQAPPSPQAVALATGGENIPWTATTTDPWLSVSPVSGSTPASASVSVDVASLAPGSYSGSVTFTAPKAVNSPRTIPVQLTLFETATLYVSPAAVSFSRPAAGPNPQPRSVDLLYPGDPVTWQATSSASWIVVSPASGITPATLSLSVSGQGLTPGTHHGSVTITSPGTPGSPQTLAVELVIGPAPGSVCAPSASYCEIFDDESLGNFSAGWVWSEPNVPQVVVDPRGAGRVMLLDPPSTNRLNGYVDLATPHPILGTEISVQVMTTGTDPADSKSLAKIEFYTQDGAAWAKTTRTFGTIRFGSNLRFQYGPTLYQRLVDPMEPGRWYAVRVRYLDGLVEVYLDGELKFTTTQAPDVALPLEAFSLTAWDQAPGAAYADLLQSRVGSDPLPQPELQVIPLSLSLQDAGGGGEEGGFAPRRVEAPSLTRTSTAAVATRPPTAHEPSAIHVPVAFEPNLGQADPSVKYLARARGHLLLVRSTDILLMLPEAAPPSEAKPETGAAGHEHPGAARDRSRPRQAALVRMKLGRSDRAFQLEAEELLPGLSHYFIGDDPAGWRTHVPHYARVVAREIYPGVDFVLRDSEGRAEYDLVVAPGADAAAIEIEYEGASQLRVDPAGDLVLETALGQRVRQPRPQIYQEVAGRRRPVAGRFKLRGAGKVGFEVATYDRRLPLVIDPVIVWSSTLGGTAGDGITALALDGAGNVYATGSTGSSNFPLAGPFQPVKNVASDAFVTKLLPSGAGVVYSSFLGGSGVDDEGRGIAVDGLGRAVVVGGIGLAGSTQGSFPINAGFFGPQGNVDVFVAQVETDGSRLVYSTRIGGSATDEVSAVTISVSGVAHLSGYTNSLDFPLASPYQAARIGFRDAFVVGISQDANDAPQLAYSTYLGGTDAATGPGLNTFTSATGIVVDAAENVFVVGETDAEQFGPQFACQAPGSFGSDAFVASLSSGQVTALRCFGATGPGSDRANDVALAPNGAVWVAGDTADTDPPPIGQPSDFPLLNAPFAFGGGKDAFVTALSADLSSISFSTPFGGSVSETATALAVDPLGQVLVTGTTFSRELPVVSPLQGCPSSHRTSLDSFLLKLDPATGHPVYATYLPGTAAAHQAHDVVVGADGSLYVGGTSTSFSASGIGADDGFVTKIQEGVTAPNAGTLTFIGGPAINADEPDGEPESVLEFSVERLGGGAGTVSADVATSDGTASAGADYQAFATTSILPENRCHADYSVHVLDDVHPELDETFSLTLSGVTGGASLGPLSTFEVTILDNDGGGGVANLEGSIEIRDRILSTGPAWQATVDVPWLTLSASSGTGPSTVLVTADPTDLFNGTYSGNVTVSADATGSPQVVSVTLTIVLNPAP